MSLGVWVVAPSSALGNCSREDYQLGNLAPWRDPSPNAASNVQVPLWFISVQKVCRTVHDEYPGSYKAAISFNSIHKHMLLVVFIQQGSPHSRSC